MIFSVFLSIFSDDKTIPSEKSIIRLTNESYVGDESLSSPLSISSNCTFLAIDLDRLPSKDFV